MCGPADFQALQTSITRLAGLSLAAIAAYVVSWAVSFYRERIPRRPTPEETTSVDVLSSFAVQGSGERSNS
jgi:hypothetical protein